MWPPPLASRALRLVVPLSLLLGTACAREPSSDEAAVYSVVLAGFCDAMGHPVFVSEVTGATSLWQSSLDYLRGESDLVSPALFADFSRQRSSRLRLSETVALRARCSYRSAAELEIYQDTSAAMQADILPPPGIVAPSSASVLTLSPIGFDASRGLALVQRFWAGGYGLCHGEFLVLQNGDTGWILLDEIGYLIC